MVVGMVQIALRKKAWISFAFFMGSGALAALSAAAQDAQAPIVFYHGQVYTAERDAPFAEAVAIRGERIVAVGTRESVERTAGAGAREIDLKGNFLMPGMIDAHAHPIDGGLSLILANFPDTSDSVPALAQFVQGELDGKRSRIGDTLLVHGIDIGFWAHVAEIDAALSFRASAHCAGPIARRGTAPASPPATSVT